jgi:NAD(P)H-hydrate epimerase
MRIPSVSREDMIEIDRMMINDIGIDLIMMMENAGRNLAIKAKKTLNDSVKEKNVAILVGKGNNGGGGLVSGRHLHNWGANAKIIIGDPNLRDTPRNQLEINKKIGMEVFENVDFTNFDLIIDSLIGYNLRGNPKEPFASLISKANNSSCPILSLDIPSGLDSSSGFAYTPCIEAAETLTLALPKTGLTKESSRKYVGNLFLADISIPKRIYAKFGINDGIIFDEDSIIKI